MLGFGFGCSCLVIGLGLWLLSVCVQVSVRKCYKGEKPSVSLTLGQKEEVKSEMNPPPLLISELAVTGVALMISESLATQFSSIIYMFAMNQLCCLQRISFHYWIVLSATNQCSLSNYSTSSETISAAELWCPSESVCWTFCVSAN
jgi:hypothetical protein